jgi:L-amino acid N-acyltransferase YncA
VEAVTITRAGAEALDQLEPLWLELHHHHQAVAGGALLDRINAELEAAGIADVVVGAFAANAGALRLYERRGFRPTWNYLSRFAGR